MGELRATALSVLEEEPVVAGPLPTPSPTSSRLEAWSRLHATLMLTAGGSSLLVGEPWPVGATALVSFALLLTRSRADWATATRTVIPNVVTALRLAIIAMAGIGLHRAPGLVWAAAVVAVFALDFLDGWLARRTNGTSAFGAHFDMETDALVVLVIDLELFQRGRLGPWILATGLLRYAYVVCLAIVPARDGEVPRSTLGRNAFGLLVIGLSVALASPGPVGTAGAALGTVAVTLSFARAFQWSYLQKPRAPA